MANKNLSRRFNDFNLCSDGSRGGGGDKTVVNSDADM